MRSPALLPRPASAALAAALLLAGCGGGFFVGISTGDVSEPPAVALAASSASVALGATLRLTAAATDRDGIDSIAFYLLDASGTGRTLLGSDGTLPYEWTLVVPDDGRTELRVFARATDGAGDQGDSPLLVVPILR